MKTACAMPPRVGVTPTLRRCCVTLRVRAIAHYPGFDVPGEARRTIAVTNAKNGGDKDLLPGFPLYLGTSLEASPKLDWLYVIRDGMVHKVSTYDEVKALAKGKIIVPYDETTV